MRIVLSLCFSFFLSFFLMAQDFILTPIAENLCKPGVTNKSPGKGVNLEYGLNPNISLRSKSTLVPESSKIDVNRRFTFKIKAPLINKQKFKLLVGWNYYGEEYNFDYIGQGSSVIFNDINNKHLKRTRISLYMIKPINHQHYVAAKGVASFNGDYDGVFDFDKRYAQYNVAVIFGVKKQDDLEWGVGLLGRKSFTNSFPVVPFAIYNHTLNDKWGIEATIPTSIMGRYNINEKSLILFGPQYDSRTYSINAIDNLISTEEVSYTMRRSELRLAFRYQRNLKSWLWIEGATGYVRNFTTSFELTDGGLEAKEIGFTPSDGMFFKLGLFLSPPRSMFK